MAPRCLAREAGALTVATVVTPLEFEGATRNKTADTAIRYLKREADLVVQFSNPELMEVTSDTITQGDFFDLQNHRISTYIRSLLEDENYATRTG